MLITTINKICNLCQIISDGRTYTCPTKEINGQLFFRFKRVWHPVSQHISEYTDELFRECGELVSRRLKK